ncbi:MAG: dethiobiotin synthase [Colwellia sp.]
MKNLFITATDTDAGKTFVACALTKALVASGKKVAVYKPVAAGCQQSGNSLVNEDALLLAQQANCEQSIKQINPIALKEAIAPHIAAAKINQPITIQQVTQGFTDVTANNADVTITEGAGGWRLPLGFQVGSPVFLSDFVKQTQLDVILVVNMKLGCLNHALLTYEAIKADGLRCIAWVANCADSKQTMACLNENIAELEQLLPMEKIAQFDYIPDNHLQNIQQKNNSPQNNNANIQEKITQASRTIQVETLL